MKMPHEMMALRQRWSPPPSPTDLPEFYPQCSALLGAHRSVLSEHLHALLQIVLGHAAELSGCPSGRKRPSDVSTARHRRCPRTPQREETNWTQRGDTQLDNPGGDVGPLALLLGALTIPRMRLWVCRLRSCWSTHWLTQALPTPPSSHCLCPSSTSSTVFLFSTICPEENSMGERFKCNQTNIIFCIFGCVPVG